MSVLSRVVFETDTTPPTTPLSVSATALSATTIRITWGASNDQGGSGLAGYRVYRATASGGTYTQIGTDLSTASLSYDDTSLSAGTTRFYRVAAFDGNGNVSAQSAIASATTSSTTAAELNPLAAIQPLEILCPRGVGAAGTGFNANNRAYFAYPGIPYVYRVGVYGGMGPYTYSLSNAPSGMTISSTGQILWPNPTANANNVTVTAQDVFGSSASQTWSIAVTTAPFRFMAMDGGSNAGTGLIDSPWQTLQGLKDNGSANQIIIFRGGAADIYNLVGATINSGANALIFDGTGGASGRPLQWMAYPGETPKIDLRYSTLGITAPSIELSEESTSNIFLDGFECYGDATKFFELAEGAYGSHVQNMHFHTGGPGLDGSNAAYIMYTGGSPAYGPTVLGCTMESAGHNSIKQYVSRKFLMAHCTLTGNGGVAMKAGCENFHLRNLSMRGCGSGIDGNMDSRFGITTSGQIGFCDILESSAVPDSEAHRFAVNVAHGAINDIGTIEVYRCTLDRVHINRLTSAEGNRRFRRNVIVNTDNPTGSPSHFQLTSVTDATKLIDSENLKGLPAAGIIDSNGLLQGSYRTTYGPGTSNRRGHEIG